MTLKSRLALRFLLALSVLGALLFIPAGSLRFWQGWAYLAISFIPGFFAFTYFYKHDPQLIERRMQFNVTGLVLFLPLSPRVFRSFSQIALWF